MAEEIKGILLRKEKKKPLHFVSDKSSQMENLKESPETTTGGGVY